MRGDGLDPLRTGQSGGGAPGRQHRRMNLRVARVRECLSWQCVVHRTGQRGFLQHRLKHLSLRLQPDVVPGGQIRAVDRGGHLFRSATAPTRFLAGGFPERCEVVFTELIGPFVVPGAGHFLQWERAELLNRTLAYFLRDLLV